MDVDHAAETILIIGIGDAPVEIGTTTVMVITTVVDMTGIETETLTGTTGDIEMETETAMEAGIAAVVSCQHLQTKLLRRSIRPPLLFSVNCCLDLIMWSRLPELNRRPSNYESDALPTELSRLKAKRSNVIAIYGAAVCSVKFERISHQSHPAQKVLSR